MADVIKKATNKFTKGLILDFSPENTRNEVLTHALNATLLTFNGNEMSLLNDFGNARVETAFLPEGYMPVGTCEYGGIIYIVSYNPLEDKSQIGCFPSPERNISSDELGAADAELSRSSFQEFNNGHPTGKIIQTAKQVLLKNDNLNPGDKFLIYTTEDIYDEKLENLMRKVGENLYEVVENPILSLSVVSIEDSGKITYLTDDLRTYKTSTHEYHILGQNGLDKEGVGNSKIDIDAYRNVLSSGYNVFKSKTSGKLAILAELIMIDSYSVTHSIQPVLDENNKIKVGEFNVVIHTEVSPTLSLSNNTIAPKLKYYYLKNSQGYLSTFTNEGTESRLPLFVNGDFNTDFLDTRLDSIYELVDKGHIDLSNPLKKLSIFDFPKADTYHGTMCTSLLDACTHTKFEQNKYHRVKFKQIKSEETLNFYLNTGVKFYTYTENVTYEEVPKSEELNVNYDYYIKIPTYTYINVNGEEQYKNETLYKKELTLTKASETDILDQDKEKFVYKTIITYRIKQENDQGKDLYIKEGENTYIKYEGTPVEGTVYYVEDSSTKLISIGNVVTNRDEYGDIYCYTDGSVYKEASEAETEAYWKNPASSTMYRLETTYDYRKATQEETINYSESSIILYKSDAYEWVDPSRISELEDETVVFVVMNSLIYVPIELFTPNANDNYIEGYEKPDGDYVFDDPISLYSLSDYIPVNYQYPDINLAHIKLPKTIFENSLSDLPFVYDYTLVPCMNYGKLDHLAVSGTVDFSKLSAFDLSNFTTWKYRIDGDQLRLTIGAEVFDTFEPIKVNGLVLEFYDLWGFAGSLEIKNKRSYSGTFTKILSLNSLNTLSKRKIKGNTYSESYLRNIAISKVNNEDGTSKFLLNGKDIAYINKDDGWNISSEDSDCGILYSNILYGVKAYLKRTDDKGNNEFILKKEFFLYTLPILNDYYYTTLDFSTLHNPQLDFVLTYKLLDNSARYVYNNADFYDGYYNETRDVVNSYLNGVYDQNELDIVKFYQYLGTSDLNLEIGLKQEYETINISYDPAVNNYFSCTLKLLSDDANVYKVVSNTDETSIASLLNYTETNLKTTSNSIGFFTDKHKETKISKGQLTPHNFINITGLSTSIPINYEFIVGYKANITNIMDSNIPTTTVCALCHQNDSGYYNYEDFGIYESNGNYLSSAMFYNSGDHKTEIFGICRQTAIEGSLEALCLASLSYESEAVSKQTPGRLNSGDPLKEMVAHIGKLTFCQPHAHGLGDGYGVNILNGETLNSKNTDDKIKYWIMPEPNGDKLLDNSGEYVGDDDTKGTGYRVGNDDYGDPMNAAPKYNLSLNTKNTILYHSEFISTMNYNKTTMGRVWGIDFGDKNLTNYTYKRGWINEDCEMVEFNGFTGGLVSDFNKKLITTMKLVYAYNPDYASMVVRVGDVHINDKLILFTTNLLSTDAKLEFDSGSLNNYVYIRSVCFADYLNCLHEYSDVTIMNLDGVLPLIQLTAGLELCGGSENPYLISSLTYNTLPPNDLEDELTFKNSDLVIVRHEDKSLTKLRGNINKKTLYGFHPTGKLVSLDASDYEIDTDGNLTVGTTISKTEKFSTVIAPPDLEADYSALINPLYKTFITIKGHGDGTSDFLEKVKYTCVCSTTEDIIKRNNNSFYILVPYEKSPMNFSFSVEPDNEALKMFSKGGASLSVWGVCVKGGGFESLDLSEQTPTVLDQLITQPETDSVRVKLSNGITVFLLKSSFLRPSYRYTGISPLDSYTLPKWEWEDANSEDFILYKVTFTRLVAEIERRSSIMDVTESIITLPTTSDYFTSNVGFLYKIKDKKALRDTSLTLNDLEYEPNLTGHRLFVKNMQFRYINSPRGKIYYRYGDLTDNNYNYKTYKNANCLFLHIGPSFVSEIDE